MTSSGHHIIKNATIDFHYHGNTDGLVLQQEVKDWVRELVGHLESQFDSIGSGNTLLSIDKLELAIDLSGHNWREEATNQILRQWVEKLPLFQPASQVSEEKISTGNERVGQLFLFYLQYGHLPWQASTSDKQQWTALVDAWLQQATPTWVAKLVEAMRFSNATKARFITMVPFHLALPLFSSTIKGEEKTIVEDYALFFESAPKRDKGTVRHMHLSLLSDIIREQEGSYLPILLAKEKALVPLLKKGTFQSLLFKQVQTNLLRGQAAEARLVKEPSEEGSAQAIQKPKSKKADQEEGIYISNAGLVVVAAFLPALFNVLKINGNGKIHTPEYAVCLLNYLATGNEEMQEFELVLPKLLCGVPLETVIDPTSFTLSKEAKQEVENVLSSVIEHWTVLKNTSVQGLREAFLQREGKLSEKGADWTLQVEQKSYDMLLQQLPWNMSMIKLPWMSAMLTTEWVY